MVLFSLSTVYYTVKGGVRIIFMRSCVFLIFSFILGVSLIEVMGLKGVVWATLLTYFLVELFSYLFISEAKEELILSDIKGLWHLEVVLSENSICSFV